MGQSCKDGIPTKRNKEVKAQPSAGSSTATNAALARCQSCKSTLGDGQKKPDVQAKETAGDYLGPCSISEPASFTVTTS